MAAARAANTTDLVRYRDFYLAGDLAQRIVLAYCLGEVGDCGDAEGLARRLANKRRGGKLRIACLYAYTRIVSRSGDTAEVARLLRCRDMQAFATAATAVTREGFGKDLQVLLKQAKRSDRARQLVSATLFRIAIRRDRAEIRRWIELQSLNNITRDALLALCRVGDVADCRFILRLLKRTERPIELYNHVRIARALAGIAGPALKRNLTKYLRSPEFWKYTWVGELRARSRLPVATLENQALAKRVLAACYCAIATTADRALVKRLMQHDYDWIASVAARRFGEIGAPDDLDGLARKLLHTKVTSDADHEGALGVREGLRALDRRLYGERS